MYSFLIYLSMQINQVVWFLPFFFPQQPFSYVNYQFALGLLCFTKDYSFAFQFKSRIPTLNYLFHPVDTCSYRETGEIFHIVYRKYSILQGNISEVFLNNKEVRKHFKYRIVQCIPYLLSSTTLISSSMSSYSISPAVRGKRLVDECRIVEMHSQQTSDGCAVITRILKKC